MKRILLPLILLISFLPGWAADIVHTSPTGQDSISAEFMRKWYHQGDLIYYLEALNDHSIVETPSYGQFWQAERLNVAIEGLPSSANRFYIDDMRVSDIFQPGSTVYIPNMERYNLLLNTHTAQFYFSLDSLTGNYVQATGNVGHLGNGEPALGTKAIFNITHRSPMESADTWKHVTARRHVKGAGQLDAAYTFHDHAGNAYRQHIYALYGQRAITREDERGLITDKPYYYADYYKVQADGYLPIRPTKAIERVGYRLNFSGQQDGGSIYLYNFNEIYDLKNYSATLYLKRQYLTTGITWETNTVHHADLSFRRNIIDQDGESFYPFLPDGDSHALSWAVNYLQPVLPWLSVHIDASNSLVYFSPTQTQWQNTLYLQSPIDAAPRDFYRYEWESRAFAGGIMENTIGLQAHYAISPKADINAHLDFTLDGILLHDKSVVSPFVQAGFNFDIHPCRWFEMGFSLAHERMPYTIDHLRYLSNDYMNARVYYAGTNDLAFTTGGRYHNMRHSRQTSYIELDIPIHFRFGRHEIILQQSYKKFFNVWHTYYADPSGESYAQTDAFHPDRQIDVYYPTPGEIAYQIDASEPFGSNWIMNSPYYFSQLTRYTYTGRKVMVSISWQSMQAAGYSGLGNGANSNSLGALSESTANLNTTKVVNNPSGRYAGIGRHDLDKGFVCRFYLGYNICQWLEAGLTIKWTDGKPFTAYQYFIHNRDVAILPMDSRGTNPTDGNFGSRHAAKYNIDLHLQGKWIVNNIPMRLNIECYNLWDFCHDLAEMSFVQDIQQAYRASMIMDVPTGLLATFSVEL